MNSLRNIRSRSSFVTTKLGHSALFTQRLRLHVQSILKSAFSIASVVAQAVVLKTSRCSSASLGRGRLLHNEKKCKLQSRSDDVKQRVKRSRFCDSAKKNVLTNSMLSGARWTETQ